MLALLPTMIAFIMIIDAIYMIMIFVAVTIILPVNMFSGNSTGYKWITKFQDNLNSIFQRFFRMSLMDIIGFRIQRTLLQLKLESFPQIFF